MGRGLRWRSLAKIATRSSASYNNYRREDYLALFLNPTRRQIRDLLLKHGELTLTEIAHNLRVSEQNVYHHLNKLLEAGLVTKREGKINGRRVTFYSLSDSYYDIVESPDKEVDLLPVYTLLVIYGALILVSVFVPNAILRFFTFIGIQSREELIGALLMGFLTTAVILIYYIVKYLHGIHKRHSN